MKGLLAVTKCVLLTITLLLPATHGRVHRLKRQQQQQPYQQQQQQQQQQQDPGYQYYFGRGGYSPLDNHLPGPERLYKTHFSRPALPRQRLPLTAEDMAPYTTRIMEPYQGHGRDRTLHHRPLGYQNYQEEVCATVKDWSVLTETVDLDGNAVVIINADNENQTFFSYRCIEPCQACKNVIGSSRCKQRYTYVKMYHYRKYSTQGVSKRQWDFVEVPSHCACELVTPQTQNPECITK